MTIATTDNAGVNAIDQQDEQILRYLGLNPNNPADRAAVAVCRAYDFDPILKHVVVIPKGGVYITRDGLLHVAHRSGQLDGIVVEQEPTLHEGEWTCRVSVYRKDMSHPFTFPGRYSAQGGNRAYAPEMALKVAESHALRRAFDVTGLPTIDEHRTPAPAPPTGGLAAALAPVGHPPAEHGESLDLSSDPHAPAPDDVPRLDVTEFVTAPQLKKLHTVLTNLQMSRDEALPFYASVIGRDVDSSQALTKDEAGAVIDALEAVEEGREPAPVAP